MNTLIIGGLLGVALVALLGATLLGLREDRAEKERKDIADATLLPQDSLSKQHTGQLAPPQVPARANITGQLAPSAHGYAHITGQLAPPAHADSFIGLNGQVHEITGELRILAQRAGELEQRLNLLTDVLEHLQGRQNDADEHYYQQQQHTNTSQF